MDPGSLAPDLTAVPFPGEPLRCWLRSWWVVEPCGCRGGCERGAAPWGGYASGSGRIGGEVPRIRVRACMHPARICVRARMHAARIRVRARMHPVNIFEH